MIVSPFDGLTPSCLHPQGLVSLLKKRVQLQKEHMKAMQKLAQSVHDDQQLRQVKFDG